MIDITAILDSISSEASPQTRPVRADFRVNRLVCLLEELLDPGRDIGRYVEM